MVVRLEDVAVRYRVPHERVATLKEHAIRLVQRRVQYDDFWALRDINLEFRRGDAVGIIGRNGSGKSTLLKVIGRVLLPTRGRVRVRGRVAPLLELGAAFHPELTGRENVFLNGALLGFTHAEMQAKFKRIVDFADLWDFMDAPLRTYSSGMIARLGFAIATDVEPDILIVDEVLGVGDTEFQQKSTDRINAFHKTGLAIFLVSHNLDAVRAICNQAIWLDNGRIAASGATEQVIEAYLDDVAAREARLAPQSDQPVPQERWGSGEAKIAGVRFLDAQGHECDRFATGEPMIARICYRARRRIERPVFGVAIYHRDGVHVNGPNTRFADYDIDWIEGEGEIDYVVPSLPLLEGNYDFSATVYDYSCTHPYDHRHRAYRFRVENGSVKEKFGMFYMDSRWEHRRL
ncbi:MAG: ABC transporter ATP-binding protein [Anaerolineales bacterium]|nr:ABC transporter ATP-binding protein [Anaerolineales bacterium]